MELNINKNKSKMIGVRVGEEDYQKILAMAKEEGVPQTEIARALISASLKELAGKEVGE